MMSTLQEMRQEMRIEELEAEVKRLEVRLAEWEELANILRDANGESIYRPASYNELEAKAKRLQAIVGELAKAHATGGFIELDSELTEQLAAEAGGK